MSEAAKPALKVATTTWFEFEGIVVRVAENHGSAVTVGAGHAIESAGKTADLEAVKRLAPIDQG